MGVKCLVCFSWVKVLAATPCDRHFFCVKCYDTWRSQPTSLEERFEDEILLDELALGQDLLNTRKCPQCLQDAPDHPVYIPVDLIPEELQDGEGEDEEEEAPEPPNKPPPPCLTCELCGRVFSTTAHKTMHMKSLKCRRSPKLKCPNHRCRSTFTREYDLKRHLLSRCAFRVKVKIARRKPSL